MGLSRSETFFSAVLLATVAFHTYLASGQPIQPTSEALADLDYQIRAEMADANIPGVVVGVAPRGKLLFGKGYGMPSVSTGRAAGSAPGRPPEGPRALMPF